MFNPTKPHIRDIIPGQPRIRMGSRVPMDAVSLAYAHSAPLNPLENIQIADLSGFILENITDQQVKNSDLWPNDQGLLTTWDGDPYLYTRSFLLTNQFKNEQPLYYAYELEHPILSRNGKTAVAGSVSIVDGKGDLLPGSYLYKVVAVATDEPYVYRVRVFTNFQKQPNETARVIYTAYKDGFVRPGHSESLNPQPAFLRSKDIEEAVLYSNNLRYYQTYGKDVGQSQVYVHNTPIRESDYRTPISFRYRATAKATLGNEEQTILTPWVYGSVFGRNHLTPADTNYRNGHKQLRGRTALEWMEEFGDTSLFHDPKATVRFSVESSDPNVTVYTQEDGKNDILAYTDLETSGIELPDTYRVQYRAVNHPYLVSVQIDDGAPFYVKGTVNVLDGHIEAATLAGQNVSLTLVRPTDPINFYLKDGKLYVYTEETEVFYVPKFSMQTQNNRQIQVLSPVEKYPIENWYLRVKNGQFTRLSSSSGVNLKYYYNVPEYFKQDFDSEYGVPFRKVLNEKPEIVGDRKLKVRYTPLYIRPLEKGFNLEVWINNIQASVRGWDVENGLVEVDMKIKETDHVVVHYYYEELAYTYRGYWDEKSQRFWHLDLNPSVGHTYTDYNSDTEEVVESPTFQLINKVIYLYMRPSAQYTESGEMISGSYEHHALFHSFEELSEANLILLAKVQVRPNSSFENIRLIDTRKRGGGLKEHITDEVMKKVEPESEFYWDIGYWDGEPYPENGVMIVHLPAYILKEHGGKFTKDEVEKIVKRHIGYGNLPIIEYLEESKEVLTSPLSIQASFVIEE